MFDGLEGCSARVSRWKQAFFLGLALVEEHDDNSWNAHSNKDNAESAECPAEIGLGVEQLGNGWSSKDRGDGWSSRESDQHHTISKRGHICNDDADNVKQHQMSDPV